MENYFFMQQNITNEWKSKKMYNKDEKKKKSSSLTIKIEIDIVQDLLYVIYD